MCNISGMQHAKTTVIASSFGVQPKWMKTSEPLVCVHGVKGTWRLLIMPFTRNPKHRAGTTVRSSWYHTREEAQTALPWWRLSWEQGHRVAKIDRRVPLDQPITTGADAMPGRTAVALPPGGVWHVVSSTAVGPWNISQQHTAESCWR